MRGDRAEKFVVFNLRLLAASFAVVGILFIVFQNGVLDVISDLGDEIGGFSRAPHTDEQFWLALGFAYMVVITGICVLAQVDVVRYRALLLVLAGVRRVVEQHARAAVEAPRRRARPLVGVADRHRVRGISDLQSRHDRRT